MGREYFPSHSQWQLDRLAVAGERTLDNSGNNGSNRYHHDQSSDKPRPMSIERALREQCRIPAQYYFVSAILDSGETVTFSGPTEYKDKTPYFFNSARWMKCATGQSPPVSDLLSAPDSVYEDRGYSHLRSRDTPTQASSQLSPTQAGFYSHNEEVDGQRGGYDRRRAQEISEFDYESQRNRKRVRGLASRRIMEMSDEQPARVVPPAKISVRIGDAEAVWSIYDQRFRGLQQTACKLIAKAWVKLVEPKKQSTHPYTGSDEKAPDWWPKPWGPTRDEKVRHKEPDHLYKKERVHLLKHILRMIVLPNSEQHPDIQKLNLNVAKLEEATTEVLSSFFADKDAPNNSKKRPYLKEIFYLAKFEERLKNGEIDAITNVYVMSEDKIPDNYLSENEESDTVRPKEEDDLRASAILSPRRVMPVALDDPTRVATSSGAALSAGSSIPGLKMENNTGLSAGTDPATQPFMGEIPHRAHPAYTPAQLVHSDLGANDHHSTYVDSGGGMNVGSSPNQQQQQHHPTNQSLPSQHQREMAENYNSLPMQQMIPNAHESDRRPSLYTTTAEYSGSPTPAGVYQTWQQHQSSNSSHAPAMYAVPPHQAQAQAQAMHSPFVPQTPVAPVGAVGPVSITSHHHGYVSHGYESMPRASYDPSAHEAMFRHNSLTNGGVVGSQGTIAIPLSQDARTISSHSLKPDPGSRHLHYLHREV
ncbi:hypothetical protein SEPCBS119000_000491 [Sporothrix epigloea]|uniref:Subtelomeric hrmA-associated cluster protein AFUB-079030/YDR124W-like helical bundle domain-containing protein n=1 Tax=Sporothrix epigloea TaxID=1892477 RepID=A0ABP0D5F7_9PEZI